MKKLKVYVAGSIPERTARAIPVIAALRASGVEITFDWTIDIQVDSNADDSDSALTDEVRRRCAEADADGVRRADLLLLLAPDERGASGAWVEFGMALALGIPVVVSGAKARRTIFTSLAQRTFDTDDEAVAHLASPLAGTEVSK